MRRLRRFDPVRWMALVATLFVVAVAAGLVAIFAVHSLPVWRHSGSDYLTGTEWFYRAARFGVLPMLYGTLVVSGIAIALAGPLALGAALFTAEVVPERRRLWIKVPIELLAGVPSVVYGLLGVLLLRDWVYRLLEPFEPLSGDTLLTGGVLLAVMILPTVMTLADDALRGVPAAQRRAARGLGLTTAQTAVSVSLPQALPGIGAALLLGLGRAMGETIAVFLVVGRRDNQWPESVLSPEAWVAAGQTLTSKLGGSETFIAYGDPLHWGAIAGLALALTLLVAASSLVGSRLARRGASGGSDA
ncbi:MAG: phosphate ABC transporter permease subunit PstC [Thermoanaerobaculia bacterium]|nr:phosphate ABC transporter permease subunit PstC [Thermoanaerobaculia bacterium]